MKAVIIVLLLLSPLLVYAQDFVVGDHELLLMPTAHTMPAGNSYFTVYEVVLLNYVYAAGRNTHVGVFSFFPIVFEALETTTVGVKQNYYRGETFQSALFASFTPKLPGYTLGNVVSVGKDRGSSFHAGIFYAFMDPDEPGEFFFMLGHRFDPSERVSIIMEYTNTSTAAGEGFNGLFTGGVRLRSSHMSWEIAGVRPLAFTGSLFLIPLLKATYYFH